MVSRRNRGYMAFTNEHRFHPGFALNKPRMETFAGEYIAMQARFILLNLILPVLLADALCLLFSNRSWERIFMVRMWELLKIYAEELEKGDNYPSRYTSQDGPVPLYIGLELFGYTTTGSSWTDDQYRYAILVLRVMNARPQHHVDSYKRDEHAKCPQGQEEMTCEDLLPSLFSMPGDDYCRFDAWDPNQFACAKCDAPTAISTFIVLAEKKQHNQGLKGINRTALANDIQFLVQHRYSFDNFWRLISRTFNSDRRARGWHTANGWAMEKMRKDDSSDRGHYSSEKLLRIKEDIAAFHKTRDQQLVNAEKEDSSAESSDNDTTVMEETSIAGSDELYANDFSPKITKHQAGDSDEEDTQLSFRETIAAAKEKRLAQSTKRKVAPSSPGIEQEDNVSVRKRIRQ